jgi:hypothetical protein
MPNYICWTKHGEIGVLEDEEEKYDNTILNYAQYSFFVYDVMGGAEDTEDNNALAQMLHDQEKDRVNENTRKNRACVIGPQHFVIPRLQITPQKVTYHIKIVAVEGNK